MVGKKAALPFMLIGWLAFVCLVYSLLRKIYLVVPAKRLVTPKITIAVQAMSLKMLIGSLA